MEKWTPQACERTCEIYDSRLHHKSDVWIDIVQKYTYSVFKVYILSLVYCNVSEWPYCTCKPLTLNVYVNLFISSAKLVVLYFTVGAHTVMLINKRHLVRFKTGLKHRSVYTQNKRATKEDTGEGNE